MSDRSGIGYAGQAGLSSDTSEFNKVSFLVRQILGLISTATLVQVKAVTNSGGVSAVGFVDVLPLVNQIDGLGNASAHEVVFGLPYFRLQGGTDAVILDPKVGDIGIAIFADRDISAVKASKAQAIPGSRRRFSMADGFYVGGVLNGVPTQYVQFTDTGITLVSPTKVSIQSPALEHNGVNVGDTHTHPGVQSGGSITGPPS